MELDVLMPSPDGLRGRTAASRSRQARTRNKADRHCGNRQRTGQILISAHCTSPRVAGCHLNCKCVAADKLSNIDWWSM
jgi:hypothetical protein